jgi:hypothetical protein
LWRFGRGEGFRGGEHRVKPGSQHQRKGGSSPVYITAGAAGEASSQPHSKNEVKSSARKS